MATDARCFAMLGPPASGKGTQGRLLAEAIGVAYLSTGARLRREIDVQSALGLQAQVFLQANQYIPDELAIELVSAWMTRHPEGWLLDGFPRSIPQAEALLEVATNVQFIHLAVPAEELRKRVTTRRECPQCGATTTSEHQLCPQCGCPDLQARADDSTEGFEKRFQAYETLTIPALEFLQKKANVVTVDGSGTRGEIALTIANQFT